MSGVRLRKIVLFVLLAFSVLWLALGCSNANLLVTTSSSSGGGNTNPIVYNYFLYGVNTTGSNPLWGWLVDKTTGVLANMSGSPYNPDMGIDFSSMTATPNGKFFYAAGTDYKIYVHNLSSTGTLSGGTPATGALANTIYTMSVDPAGFYMYVVIAATSSNLLHFSINQSTGVLTLQNTYTVGPGGYTPMGFTLGPYGARAYASTSQSGSSNFVIYTRNIVTGALTVLTTYSLASSPQYPPVVDPTGRFIYVGTNDATTSVNVFYFDGTTYNPMTGVNPGIVTSMAIDPTSHYLYVANSLGYIKKWDMSQIDGTLSNVSSLNASLSTMYSMTTDHLSLNLYVLDVTSNTVKRFPLTPGTGVVGSAVQNFGIGSGSSNISFVAIPQP